nr:transposase [Suicoccus acidiformans]
MLLKLLLLAYSQGIKTSRPMAEFAEDSLAARWLTQEQTPSHETICRFRRSAELREILTHSFERFTNFLKEQGLIDAKVFIDGTKLLADANKYSFQWKKNTIRYEKMNRRQLVSLVNELNDNYNRQTIPEDTQLILNDLGELITEIEIRIKDLNEAIEADPKKSPNQISKYAVSLEAVVIKSLNVEEKRWNMKRSIRYLKSATLTLKQTLMRPLCG